MEPVIYNLLFKQQTDYSRTLTLKDADGNSMDLTGCSAQAQIRRKFAEPVLVELDTVVDAATGTVTFSVPSEAELAANCKHFDVPRNYQRLSFDDLPKTSYVWDLKLSFPDGLVWCPLEGGVMVLPTATRSDSL